MSPLPSDHASAQFPDMLADTAVVDRYRMAWRGPAEFFAQLVLDDLASPGASGQASVLDIGCGGGFMGSGFWQAQIAAAAGQVIGVEPDAQAEPAPVFAQVLRQAFEDVLIEPASIDLAYAAMVIEHVARPMDFFAKLARVLRPGGVFWAFTVDRRHYFSWFSQMIEVLRLKEIYLDRVRGRKGDGGARYENFPVHYRCNSPTALARLAGEAFSMQSWSLHRVGQLDGYVPYRLRRFSRLADRAVIRAGLPGSVLVARMVRR